MPEKVIDLFSEPAAHESPVLSVTAVSQQLKQCVESQFARIRVRGEISGFKRHSSGHLYFSLKDANGDAVLNAICWRGTHTSVPLEEGLEIIATGRITTYPGRSNYQIIVQQAEAAGEGALLKLLQERKKMFAAEGLFNQKRPLPRYPDRIGVITSQTGAVILDILHRLADRYPCPVTLWPVAVQGAGAAEQIAHAIASFNLLDAKHRPSVLIVARGGGSIEDLWAFNEECVVRAAYNSAIPVISAVGHETDTSLLDFAADVRAPTPTAAAELATPVLRQVIDNVLLFKQRSVHALIKTVESMELKLQALKLPRFSQWLNERYMRLEDASERLHRSMNQICLHKSTTLEYAKKLLKPPYVRMAMAESSVQQFKLQVEKAIQNFLAAREDALQSVADRLDHSSYAAIMQRGFCIATNEAGEIMRHKAQFKTVGESLHLHLCDGVVSAQVSDVGN